MNSRGQGFPCGQEVTAVFINRVNFDRTPTNSQRANVAFELNDCLAVEKCRLYVVGNRGAGGLALGMCSQAVKLPCPHSGCQGRNELRNSCCGECGKKVPKDHGVPRRDMFETLVYAFRTAVREHIESRLNEAYDLCVSHGWRDGTFYFNEDGSMDSESGWNRGPDKTAARDRVVAARGSAVPV